MMPENSIEGRAEPFLKRVENVLDDLAKMKGEYMNACKGVRGKIKEIYKEAKDEEVPVKALKSLVKYRELARKQAALAEDLEDQDADDYETFVAALGAFGDTPLGQAALGLGGDARKRKPRSPAAEHAQALSGQSTEETEALGEIESEGIGGAAASFTVQQP